MSKLNIKKLIEYGSIPDKIALINDKSVEISYQNLLMKAYALSKFIHEQNVNDGDRVTIEVSEREDFLVGFLSALFGNYCVVPINASLPPADVEYIQQTVKAKYQLKTFNSKHNVTWDETRKCLEKKNHDKLGVIFFTSGTTQKPKGVCHSMKSFLENASHFNERVGHDSSVRMLHVMPVGYVAGMLNTFICPLLAGGVVVLAKQFSPFTANDILSLASKCAVNSMWLSPTMAAFFARLNIDASTREWIKKDLKNVHVGTAPLNLVQKESFEKTFGVKCLESFGMTEVLLVAGNASTDLYKLFSAGKIIEGTWVEARSEGKQLSPGQEGNLFLKTDYMMLGYWDAEAQKPKANAEWMDTGDIGIVDADNYLFITGRSKDLIIKGGVNFSPRAIEEILLQHPQVDDVAVVGAKHAFWGEEIVAFVISGTNVDESSLKEFCKIKLASDAVPSRFIQVSEFPRTSTGKVQKAKLRERLNAAH